MAMNPSSPHVALEAVPATPMIVRGIVGILFGAASLLLPGLALVSLVLLFAAYLIVDGIFAIVAAGRAARGHGAWGWLTLEGVVTVAAGLFAAFLPGATVIALMVMLAVWACLSGVFLLIAALSGRAAQGRWWMALAGAVSIVWGGVLFGWPGAGAFALVLWLGAYALVFGAVMLVTGLRMRAGQRGTREFLP